MWREGPCILGNEYMFWCHGSWTQHFAGQAEAMRWLPALPFRVWGLPFPHRGLTWFEALSCFSHPRAHSQGVCPDSSVTCRVLSASVCAANSTGLVCGWWSVQLFSIPLITCLQSLTLCGFWFGDFHVSSGKIHLSLPFFPFCLDRFTNYSTVLKSLVNFSFFISLRVFSLLWSFDDTCSQLSSSHVDFFVFPSIFNRIQKTGVYVCSLLLV